MFKPSIRLLAVLLATALLAVAGTTARGQDSPGEPPVQAVIPVDLACRTAPRPRAELFDQMTAALASTTTPTTSTGGLTVVNDPIGSFNVDMAVDGVLWIEDSELVPGVGSTGPLPDDIARTLQQLNACDGQLELPFRYGLFTDEGLEQQLRISRLDLNTDRLYVEQYEPVDDGEVDSRVGVLVYSHVELLDGRVAAVVAIPLAVEATSYLRLDVLVFEQAGKEWKVDWAYYGVVSTTYVGTPVASPETMS